MSEADRWTDDRERQAKLDVGDLSRRTADRDSKIQGSVRFGDDRDRPPADTEQAPLVADADADDSGGFARFRADTLGFEDYGPTSRQPLPLPEAHWTADQIAMWARGFSPASLGDEAYCPGDYHIDDQHREDHYPEDEEAAIAADLESIMHDTTDTDSNEYSQPNDIRTDGGQDIHEVRHAAQLLNHAVGLTWSRTDVPQTQFGQMLRDLAECYETAPEVAATSDSDPLRTYTQVAATDGGTGRAKLRELYAEAQMLAPGSAVEYRGYQLRKVEAGGPYHDEFAVLNPDGKKVESYTVGAFDDLEAFRTALDELVDYDPVDLGDWLHRDRDTGQRRD